MINDLAFNQDFTCLSVSTAECHKIFNCDPFGEFYVSSGSEPTPTAYLRMLFSTLLTIVVPESGLPMGNRVLKVFNLKQNLKICELTFPLNIVDLMLNRKRLVVILEVGQIYVYDLSSMRLVKVLESNPYPSQAGSVAALSVDDKSYLVLPLLTLNGQTDLFNADVSRPGTPMLRPCDSTLVGSLDSLIEFTHKNKQSLHEKKGGITLDDLQKDSKGWVIVYDTIALKPRLLYKAHESEIAKIAISNTSLAIATASSKGTIVRVSHLSFDLLEEFEKLKITHITSLRRGHNLSKINALAFNMEGSVLGCGSESNTIHFFRVGPMETEEEYSSDEDARSGQSLEDLNENLANLLILSDSTKTPEKLEKSYFSLVKRSGKLLNNLYTKLFIKKLPYKDYFDNLIWEPPRRSFAFIKLPEYTPSTSHKNVEIGFSSTGLLMVASYHTGTFYQYQLPLPHGDEEREECSLLCLNSLT